MIKIYKILIFVIFLAIPFTVHSHVQHYEKLNRIEFDIYRNNVHIGTHVFSFRKMEDKLAVDSEINFQIKKIHLLICLTVTIF